MVSLLVYDVSFCQVSLQQAIAITYFMNGKYGIEVGLIFAECNIDRGSSIPGFAKYLNVYRESLVANSRISRHNAINRGETLVYLVYVCYLISIFIIKQYC